MRQGKENPRGSLYELIVKESVYLITSRSSLKYKSILRALDFAVVHLGLKFLALLHLSDGLHKVLLQHVVSFSTNSSHTSFCAHVTKICSVKAISQLANSFIVYSYCVNRFTCLAGDALTLTNIAVLSDLCRVNLQHINTTLLVGQGNFNLSVQTTRSQQSRIQDVCGWRLDLMIITK